MRSRRRVAGALGVLGLAVTAMLWAGGGDAAAAPAQQPIAAPSTLAPATVPATTTPDGKVSIGLDLGGLGEETPTGTDAKPSRSIVILVGLTILSLAPSLVVLMTSFTRMVVVLGIVRNAIGLQTVPPNQVITGLALFLSLFVMAPTVKAVNDQAWQPYQRGEITQTDAVKAAEKPLKDFMLRNTRREELDLMIGLSRSDRPDTPEQTSLMTLIPAFVLSELKSAFIIGVMVLLPFLVIDLVVSSGLMSLGMMMLPPVFVSLPFKLLLFVMVDGWSLIAHALVSNYH